MLGIFPGSPVFTTVAKYEKLGALASADIRMSRLQTLYRLLGRHEPLLPLMPRAIEAIDLKGYDLVLSSSHAVAKGVVVPPSAVHVCYCHTPMRYAWEMEDRYLNDFHIPSLLRPAIKRQLSAIRRWDLSTAKRVDVFIANSTTTQERITRYYGRESTVLPPPVADRFFAAELPGAMATRDYYLAIGRMVPYKRFDLLIEVANALHLPLKIAGSGSDEHRLRKMAGATVEFLGRVEDSALPSLYAHAKALLFPQEEDAGIVLLEAHACGTPAIAFDRGGARDVLKEGVTGTFFDAQTPDALREAITRMQTMTFDAHAIRNHAQQFHRERFVERLRAITENALTRGKVQG